MKLIGGGGGQIRPATATFIALFVLPLQCFHRRVGFDFCADPVTAIFWILNVQNIFANAVKLNSILADAITLTLRKSFSRSVLLKTIYLVRTVLYYMYLLVSVVNCFVDHNRSRLTFLRFRKTLALILKIWVVFPMVTMNVSRCSIYNSQNGW